MLNKAVFLGGGGIWQYRVNLIPRTWHFIYEATHNIMKYYLAPKIHVLASEMNSCAVYHKQLHYKVREQPVTITAAHDESCLLPKWWCSKDNMTKM